jgi:hypothetical protein
MLYQNPVNKNAWNIILCDSILKLQENKEKEHLLNEISEKIGRPITTSLQGKSMEFSAKDCLVGMSRGRIIPVNSKVKLYTKELGPCIAILTRTDSQLGLFHFFKEGFDRDNFREHLIQLKNGAVNKNLEIFLIGGRSSNKFSQEHYQGVSKIIEELNKTEPKVAIFAEDNKAKVQFDIATSDNFYVKCSGAIEEVLYCSSVGLSYVAFDENGNPYAGLGFRAEGYQGDYSKLSIVDRHASLQPSGRL